MPYDHIKSFDEYTVYFVGWAKDGYVQFLAAGPYADEEKAMRVAHQLDDLAAERKASSYHVVVEMELPYPVTVTYIPEDKE